jgi:hypothetical protein
MLLQSEKSQLSFLLKSNFPLRVLNIHFQSIKRKQHLVNNIIESSKPDIVVGTETWLKPNIHTNEVFPQRFFDVQYFVLKFYFPSPIMGD